MKTKTLILTIGAVALTAITFNASATEPLLSPRAAGNVIKHVATPADAPTVTVVYNDSNPAFLSPRARGNEIRTVKGVDNDVNPALMCQKTMIGSPKAVAECSSHTTMPGCKPASVAVLK